VTDAPLAHSAKPEEHQRQRRQPAVAVPGALDGQGLRTRGARRSPAIARLVATPGHLTDLQRTVGNRATGRFLAGKSLAPSARRVAPAGAVALRSVIHRAYVNGTAEKDAPLFEQSSPIPDEPVAPLPKAATDKGITETNLGHYLERHTYKYQKLNAKTVSPAATLFPHGTTSENVKAYLLEALGKVKDTDTIGTTPVSLLVDIAAGIKVNLGALKGGKLAAFFPISGTGVVDYTPDELKAIRDAKKPKPPATGGATT
jgi:hypothetical protein